MESGFILIDKPAGMTSHDVVDRLRRISGIKKIGHAGTLDPFATGLLIMGVGREATRQLDRFLKLDKEYIATLKLGAVSDTYDRDGVITKNTENKKTLKTLSQEEIENVLEDFRGEIDQVPPMYSAKKVKGKKLYELARQGKEIERKSVRIKIYELRIKNYNFEEGLLSIICRVSSGTYIRSLGHDIGAQLGCGAYVDELRRTSIGSFQVTDAAMLAELTSENWQSYLKTLY